MQWEWELTLGSTVGAPRGAAVADDACLSNNGEMFLNRCFVQYPGGFLTILANLIQQVRAPLLLRQTPLWRALSIG